VKILRVLRWLVVLAIVVAFALFVWPTRYRYEHMTADSNLVIVRIDRFNGDADMLVPDEGWTPVEGTNGNTEDPQPVKGT
jgi:hypothetical protein